MSELFTQIMDYLKNTQTHALPVGIASTVFLSAPSQFITWLGFDSLAQNLKPYFGAALVLSMAVLTASACRWLATTARQKMHYRMILRTRIAALEKLSPDEIEILRSYVEQNTKTRSFDLTNGVIVGLVKTEILYQTDYGCSGEFAFNMWPWAWDYLNEHKQVIGLHE